MSTDDQAPLEGHVVEGLQQPFTETTDPHGIRARTTEHGTEYVCACGQWDGWAKGPSSTRFVRNQHAEHLRNVAAAEASDQQARMQIAGEVVGETTTRSCSICGCTENNACTIGGKPCHWVGPELCSACAPFVATS